MDWFVDAVGVPASIGSGTGKEEETCRPPESEVPPGVVWEEPKNRRKEAGSEEKSNRRWVSVLVAQFALERGKTQHHQPHPSYLSGDRLRFLSDSNNRAYSAAAPSGFAAPSASPPLSPGEDGDGFVPEEAVGLKRGLVRGRGRGAGDLR